MDALRLSVHSLYDFHTQLFSRVLEGLETTAAETPAERNNHAAWIAGHLVSTRFRLGTVMGLEVSEPFPDHFAFGKSIDPTANYPALRAQQSAWESISAQVRMHLSELPASDWLRSVPWAVPVGNTRHDFFAYFLHHEAYHLGQLGYLRKWAGLEAVKHHR